MCGLACVVSPCLQSSPSSSPPGKEGMGGGPSPLSSLMNGAAASSRWGWHLFTTNVVILQSKHTQLI